MKQNLMALLGALVLIAGGCDRGPQSGRPDNATGSAQTTTVPSELKQASAAESASPASNDGPTLRAALADFNRGAAYMEQYQYSKAAAAFQRVVQQYPDWTAARFNLGLAYLNMMGESEGRDNLEQAKQTFLAILQHEPDHAYANFCLGMYYQHLGEMEPALERFHNVYQQAPNDPYVAYKYAETLRTVGRIDDAIPILESIVEENPGFISAAYLLATLYTRAGSRDRAMPLFDRFKELNAAELTGGSHVVQAKYGAAGRYYQVLGADDLPLPPRDMGEVSPVVFSPKTRTLKTKTTAWDWGQGTIGLVGIAVADVDADGDLDLCLTAAGDQGDAAIWINDGTGNFTAGPSVAQRVVSPCFGDVDNDGDIDLWLGRAGPDGVLLNDGDGNFQPGTYDALAGPDTLTHGARLLDLDSDGDLDYLAYRLASGNLPPSDSSRAAAASIYNTNGDGTFVDVAPDLGLALPDTPIAAVAYDDLDNDYDLDLVLFPAAGTPLVWVNHRLGDYRIAEAAATGLDVQAVRSATTGDPDKDGDRDLLVFTAAGVRLLENQGELQFLPNEDFANRHGSLGGTGGQFADMDNDGDLDIVIGDAMRRDGTRGPVLLINTWPDRQFVDVTEVDPGNLLAAVTTGGDASCVVADFNGDGRNDLLLAPAGKEPVIIDNVTDGGHWIQLDLVGTRPKDNKARSNHSAIGARVEVKTGAVHQQFLVGGSSGAVAMQPLRVHAGLGDSSSVDWLRILWPDAVLQGELELAANGRTTIEETQRKASSCPYLFAWNGERFEFVADFGGVGGLGYLVAPGQYAPPDPTEYLPIPRLEPQGDHYVLQSLTMLEEITYFDEAKLIAVDHPQGTTVYPHEMMAISVPPPQFEMFCFDQPILPRRAVDHRGIDVTQALTAVDRRYAGATQPDPRFAGLAEEHFVELDFGDRLGGLDPQRRIILVLHGWVEYGYSSTNYAAAQAGLQTRAPTIEVFRDGRWIALLRELGYPAGINHVMTVELTGLMQPGDHRLRISSNMELYWDQVFLGEHLPDAEVRIREVAAASADLHFRGYPREYSPDGQHPNLCDYDNVDRSVGWKLMAGDYTRFGDVTALLDAADDRFVITGHGEEITLRFPVAGVGPLPAGSQRSFLLKTDSYCKDMDLYTAHPQTVQPLPFHGMSGYPYGPDEQYPDTQATREYRSQYNTRRVGQHPARIIREP
jgi:tetratricopeptide (TPR) repeat protein